MKYNNNFAEILVKYRKINNLTQMDLAKKVNVTKSSISLYELGERLPDDMIVLEKISETINVDFDILLFSVILDKNNLKFLEIQRMMNKYQKFSKKILTLFQK